ncbi:hypothetical protein CC78DRAFT_547275 [Lojkania enalia]|uniref:Uncharacterized protein n=1 Tax=Lojkania enalia TaxID=147567 RepID=A0A9P4K0P9_9PLEO|nr:hypothetical protein CC78DRAFT_547275 [Didymosphaeria enalia]
MTPSWRCPGLESLAAAGIIPADGGAQGSQRRCAAAVSGRTACLLTPEGEDLSIWMESEVTLCRWHVKPEPGWGKQTGAASRRIRPPEDGAKEWMAGGKWLRRCARATPRVPATTQGRAAGARGKSLEQDTHDIVNYHNTLVLQARSCTGRASCDGDGGRGASPCDTVTRYISPTSRLRKLIIIIITITITTTSL